MQLDWIGCFVAAIGDFEKYWSFFTKFLNNAQFCGENAKICLSNIPNFEEKKYVVPRPCHDDGDCETSILNVSPHCLYDAIGLSAFY